MSSLTALCEDPTWLNETATSRLPAKRLTTTGSEVARFGRCGVCGVEELAEWRSEGRRGGQGGASLLRVSSGLEVAGGLLPFSRSAGLLLLFGGARERLWRLVGELCCSYVSDISGCAF